MTIVNSNRAVISSICALSVGVIFFLFWLIYFREPLTYENSPDLGFMPALNATLNFLSAAFLTLGYIEIRKRNRKRHIIMMLSALTFSSLFLLSYLIYHTFHGDTPYQGEGLIRYIYFFVLISHVVLSVIVLPLILTTVYFAAKGKFTIHPKVARITLPLWLYVSITGVLVYLMLYHF